MVFSEDIPIDETTYTITDESAAAQIRAILKLTDAINSLYGASLK